MKLVTRDTDYAVRALCYMAGKKHVLSSVSELVKELKIPRPFLRKILQELAKHGIVTSHKGLGGGFKLARYPHEITIAGLIRIFQGKLELNDCLFKKKICPNRAACPLKKKIDNIGKHVESELSSITIGSLLKKGG